jgi:hypothetical protein
MCKTRAFGQSSGGHLRHVVDVDVDERGAGARAQLGSLVAWLGHVDDLLTMHA